MSFGHFFAHLPICSKNVVQFISRKIYFFSRKYFLVTHTNALGEGIEKGDTKVNFLYMYIYNMKNFRYFLLKGIPSPLFTFSPPVGTLPLLIVTLVLLCSPNIVRH